MKTLYSKFAITTILIMIFSGIFSFILANVHYQEILKKQNDEKIMKIALNMAEFASKQNSITQTDYFEHIGAIGYQILVVNEKGDRHFFGADFRENNLSEDITRQVFQGKVYHGIRDFPHKTFVTGFFANELKNSVGVPIQSQNEKYALFIRPDIKLMFNEMRLLFGWLLISSIVMSIIMVLISTKYLVLPIRKLNLATQEISEGNFSIKLDINRKDELGNLAASFSIMSNKLEKVDTLRKELISNISHDIQSPLTNIKGYINLIENSQISDQEKEQYTKVVHSEINRLSNMTKQLMILATIESKQELLEISRVNIGEQLKKMIQQYQWRIMDKGIMISYSLPDLWVKGDSSLLNSVWENLLTNAIKYNYDNGTIDIELLEAGSRIEVIFKDTGVGLDQEQQERIFDRFYRADTSRGRSIEGTGLGLAIVKSIVDLHHGSIEIDSIKGKGTSIKVSLPTL
jgi:signal transduction histidine kinase